MVFDNIIGQKKIKEILTRTLTQQRLPHGLLFCGDEGLGTEACAIELAKSLICQESEAFACDQCSDCRRISQLSHPDVIFVYPMPQSATIKEQREIIESIISNPYYRLQPWANPTISINQIRELKKTAMLTSFENKGRVVIITDAHRMTIEATNSLLKILEEPPARMNIILISSHPNLLLPTIVSRCQLLKFDPLASQDIEQALINRNDVQPERAKLVAQLSFGNYRQAMELLEEKLDEQRQQMLDLLRTVIKDDFERMMLVEQLARQRDKKAIIELLELLLLWFRDVLIYTQTETVGNLIVNSDQLEILKRFCSSFENIDCEKIVIEIEKAIELVNKNVYLNLILINLFYSLKQNLRRKHV
jgi:DNA polymerase III subunit delta'